MSDDEVVAWLRSLKNVASKTPDFVSLSGRIEEGGQGIVFKGEVSGEPAAVKVYFPGQLGRRVDREVEALKELDCANVVKLLWSDVLRLESGSELPIVGTNFIEGKPLDQVIADRGYLNVDEIGVIAFDVANAIYHMWERRIVHRDLKPSNIMIRPNGRACVIDLGVARHVERSSLTAMGATWGTYGYMSPEQTKFIRQLTCKSDIFGLGVILVECASGRHPSNGDQMRLLSLGLHETLHPRFGDWAHCDLVKSFLHPRQTKRPKPKQIMDALSEYKPSES